MAYRPGAGPRKVKYIFFYFPYNTGIQSVGVSSTEEHCFLARDDSLQHVFLPVHRCILLKTICFSLRDV